MLKVCMVKKPTESWRQKSDIRSGSMEHADESYLGYSNIKFSN